jgi:Protein of unknown function (DUF1579)
MAMPGPTEEHHRLEKLIGSWEGEETIHPNPWDAAGGKAIGRVANRGALDGFAVVQDYEQERDGAVHFRGHGVFRWDAAAREYVLHWFDSFGMPPSELRGSLDGGLLTLENVSPQGRTRAVFDFRPHSYDYRMEVSGDGEHWQPLMEGLYHRVS